MSHGGRVKGRIPFDDLGKDEIGMFDAIEPDLMSLGLLEIWRRNRG